MLKYRQIYR